MSRQHPCPIAISYKILIFITVSEIETIVRTYWMTHVNEELDRGTGKETITMEPETSNWNQEPFWKEPPLF